MRDGDAERQEAQGHGLGQAAEVEHFAVGRATVPGMGMPWTCLW